MGIWIICTYDILLVNDRFGILNQRQPYIGHSLSCLNRIPFTIIQPLFLWLFKKELKRKLFTQVHSIMINIRAILKKKYLMFYLKFTAQKMKFSINDFFSICDQICSLMRIWSHLLKKYFMENFIFSVVTSPTQLPFAW